jgi:hypothetical protein
MITTLQKSIKGGDDMHVNTERFSKLVETKFSGSCNKCAKELKVAPSTVWRVVKGDSKAGLKLLTNLMQYCNKHNLNYYGFIFLD